jgi:hypothetical protein
MRVTRAFVASCGAGLSLVAASVAALFLLSAVVAVRGWPGINPSDDVPHVTLADAQLTNADDGAAVAVAASAGAGLAPIVLGGADPAAGDGTSARSRRGGRADRTSRVAMPGQGARPTLVGGIPPAGGPGASQPAGQPSRPRPNLVNDTTSGAAEVIRDTGSDAGNTTEPAAPGSGSAATQVAGAVADTVDDAGRAAAGGAGQAVTDSTADAVRDTGQAVDKVTAGDVGGAVDEVTSAVGGLLGVGVG